MPARGYAPQGDGPVRGDRKRFTNVDRIAAATGIPRESVRRKVAALIAAGWVVRFGTRALAIHPQAAVDLQPSTLTVFDVLDRLFAEFAAALVANGELQIERRRTPA